MPDNVAVRSTTVPVAGVGGGPGGAGVVDADGRAVGAVVGTPAVGGMTTGAADELVVVTGRTELDVAGVLESSVPHPASTSVIPAMTPIQVFCLAAMALPLRRDSNTSWLSPYVAVTLAVVQCP
ncbi:hypothetical protein GCM10011610_09990 [Nocardia rhizosphaerihabitans]|uniref:Uncharacterized protein n=1 Tax=Nocardia rhizosphaerihabitans TaxID=1691570 RepID=A0ABQ2KA91_9NOCA|nr:hypothetical protein GCM10011610_09990 [Nocardia rhizosphaerihabitans]